MNYQGIQTAKIGALRIPAWLSRLVTAAAWLLVSVYFLAAAVVLGLRYWVLPNVDRYSDAIEAAVSRSIGERVSIGAVGAGWNGLRPELDLTDVRIHDREGRVALSLPAIEATVSWTSVPLWSIRFHSLALDQPKLEIRRDAAQRLFVAGIELKNDGSGSGVSDWLLSQREIVIRNASLSWDDEHRAAAPLRLSGVSIAVRNNGERHRFALRASTSSELASALDVRGELHGRSIEQLREWNGRLYAELGYTDLAAWKQWFDYPIEILSGKGGVRLWFAFSDARLTEATLDVALADASVRLTPELPVLDLAYLEGRLGAKQNDSGYAVFGRKVVLQAASERVALAPADFDFSWERARPGRSQRGELRVDALQLQPMAQLAEFLPIPERIRRRLVEIQPRGSVSELKLSWTGEPDSPEQYSASGRFAALAARTRQDGPGFSGLTGRFEGNEKGGNLQIGSEKATLVLPGILSEGATHLDSVSAQLGWLWNQDRLELRLAGIALSNREIAGTLSGSYSGKAEGPGEIDLTGSFSRLDARSAYRYIPWLPERVRDYLKNALQGGAASDIRLLLRGDLSRFPFDDAKQGVFQASGRARDVDFSFAEGWPRLNGVNAELRFDGRRMQIDAQRAGVLGARVAAAKATIADLFNRDEVLHVEGQADGSTAEFLRFVESSPVTGYIDGFTTGMRAVGSGRLQLALDLPLRRLAQVKVSGSYQFAGNQIVLDSDIPPLAQVNGRLEFTESGLAARNLASQFLGGATTISIATAPDGAISASAQGTANVAGVRGLANFPLLLERASGSSGWRGTLSIRKRSFDLVVESSLMGIALDLPPPLGKVSADAMPFRLERTNNAQGESARRIGVPNLPAGGDAIAVAIGRTVNATLMRSRETGRWVVERGAIGINERAPVPVRPGITVTGSLAHVDLDRWRGVLGGDGEDTPAVTSINLKAGTLDFAERRFNEFAIRASFAANAWNAAVTARELSGDVSWRPEGRGRVVARLRHFTVPDSVPDAASGGTHADAQIRELPALDIVAERFVKNQHQLGRLELVAFNQARDWRIERLVLSNAESTLSAEGYWQNWALRPSVGVNFQLDVKDTGGYLDRVGYPGTVRGGTAHLAGKLGWSGNPHSIDYPTLVGNVALKVEKGQFLKADPGPAKLLGVLSLQALLTFDLRDLFAQGFAFESISSTAQIAKGVLTTKDFDMRGATARVNMRGDIDLARETQSLRMRVVPALGDSAAAAMLLLKANPITGLGALIAQRILKDPLGQIFSFEYKVTGNWDEAKVERADRTAPEEAEESGKE